MHNSIGQKLKYFRKRANLSQLELETTIGAAPGSISRIESGSVNPNKETVIKIAQAAGINDKELDYIIGITAIPATEAEISSAIAEVEYYFSQKVFAYLIDERWRMWKITDHFRKTLGLSEDYIAAKLGTVTIQFITDPAMGILDKFSEKYNEEVLDNNLRYFYKEVGFMVGDDYFEQAVKSINSNPLAKKLWEAINYEQDIKYNFRFGRKVYFRLFNQFDVTFIYTYEPLLNNSRFKVVEFIPESRFTKLLAKFI